MHNNNLFSFAKQINFSKHLSLNTQISWEKEIMQTNKFNIKIASSMNYQIFIDNELVSYGPTRNAHGHFFVDNMGFHIKKGQKIAMEFVYYGIDSFAYLKQDPFIIFEIESAGEVIYFTDAFQDDFSLNNKRISRVQRYSYQRPFVEVYDYIHELNKVLPTRLLDTNYFIEKSPIKFYTLNKISFSFNKTFNVDYMPIMNPYKDRSLTLINEKIQSFAERELKVHLSDEAQNFVPNDNGNIFLYDFEMDHNRSGFIELEFESDESADVWILFDEIKTKPILSATRLECCNAIKLKNQLECKFISFEIYTMKYLQVISTSKIKIKKLNLIESKNNLILKKHNDICLPKELDNIYHSAIRTFKYSCTDIPMDCPSRERAGYLSDSYFTGKAEFLLTGNNIAQENFLTSFLKLDSYENIPDGMVPMCYPADHSHGTFIPNYGLWYIFEVYDFLKRNNRLAESEKFKNKFFSILNYFLQYENEFGLLENLEGWVFVEHSKAQDYTKNISFPVNFEYYKALKITAELFNDDELLSKSNSLKTTINSYRNTDGTFPDMIIRNDNQIFKDVNSSLICQYLSFFCDVCSETTNVELFELLTSEQITKNHSFINVEPFIGSIVQIEFLVEHQKYDLAEQIIIKNYTHMANLTGTLWEKMESTDSCCHGINSYLANLILKITQ